MRQRLVGRAIGAMEKHTGTVAGFRRAHARGVHFHGTFTPTGDVAALTSAEHLRGTQPIPTLVRLSNASGSPYAPDRPTGGRGRAMGLAMRFELPSGGHSTWAAASIPNFPARIPEDFIRLVEAQRPNGKPNLALLLWYTLTRGYARPALKGVASIKSPASFATARFNGLHAYYLVAPDRTRQAFRYSWIPEAGVTALAPDKDSPRQYLIREIEGRAAVGPVGWQLIFQLAAPGDPTDDVTKQWPDDRENVVAGHLLLTRPHEDQSAVENLVFDPTNVPAGIELSDDPILRFRSEMYGESHRRRTGEQRPPGAPG